MKTIWRFFDRLEDKVRSSLSRTPIIYALVAGVGVVLFWRGVWELSDRIGLAPLTSILLGLVIMLSSGVLVAEFLGNRILISGLRGEKKIEEKTLQELEEEESFLDELHLKVDRIESDLAKLLAKFEEPRHE